MIMVRKLKLKEQLGKEVYILQIMTLCHETNIQDLEITPPLRLINI